MKESATFLRDQVALNGFHSVEVILSAVGEKNGIVSLKTASTPYSAGLTSRCLEGPGLGTVEVPMTTLDEFFAEREPPQLIKIDVEGMEGEVLRGAAALLDRHAPAVVFEAVWVERGGTSYAQLLTWLRGLGYEVFALTPRGLKAEPLGAKEPGSMNVLAARPRLHELALSSLRGRRFPRNQAE
jgi:FkbM family methyltransferase